MKNLGKRFMVLFLAFALMCTLSTFAAAEEPEFSDMPNDYSTSALEAAVSNGLMEGADGKILPDDNLKRDEMAAIIVRAFGATEKASLTSYTDVDANEWYYSTLAEAVYMKIMEGDNDKLMPNDYITREQAFAIIARALSLKDGTAADLAAFSDASSVSSWAVGSVAAMVKNGYVHGSDNAMLNAKSNITRKDFAVVMDNIIKQYISKAGTYTEVADGTVLINSADVTLKNVTITGDLIIGDGVGDGNVTLDGVTVKGTTIIRGGGVNSIELTGNTTIASVCVAKVGGNVRIAVGSNAAVNEVAVKDGKSEVVLEGNIDTVTVATSETPIVIQNAKVTNVAITAANADVTVAKTATVNTVTAQAAAAEIKVDGTVTTVTATAEAKDSKVAVSKGATVTTVEAAAEGTEISGSGTVKNATVTANNVSIGTSSTKTTVAENVTGTTNSDGKAINSGTTTTTPSSSTSSGSGSSGGGSGSSVTYYSVAATISNVTASKEYTTSSVPSSASLVSTVLDLLESNKTDIHTTFFDDSQASTTYIAALVAEGKAALSSQSDWTSFISKYSSGWTNGNYTYALSEIPEAAQSISTAVSAGTYTGTLTVTDNTTTTSTVYTLTIVIS